MCHRVVKLALVPDFGQMLNLKEAEVAIESLDPIEFTLLDHFDGLALELSFKHQLFFG